MTPPLLPHAIQFATRAHHGQTRKGNDLPYIVHPYAVGLLLSRFGFSEAIIAAGLLHDTLEDCGVTEEVLASEFGAEIAALVMGASEPDKSLPWHERKQHTIDSLNTATWPVKAVVATDKLDNLRSMAADFSRIGDALWSRFKQGREQQEWYYRGVFQALVGIPPGAPESYRQLLGELDDAIELVFPMATSLKQSPASCCNPDGLAGDRARR